MCVLNLFFGRHLLVSLSISVSIADNQTGVRCRAEYEMKLFALLICD